MNPTGEEFVMGIGKSGEIIDQKLKVKIGNFIAKNGKI